MTGDWSPRAKVLAGTFAGIIAAAAIAAAPAIVTAIGDTGLPPWALVFLTTVVTQTAAYMKTETKDPASPPPRVGL